MDDFDATKGYKRIAFREDRDLLDTELNELQEIAIHERTALMDRLFTPGSIVAGLDGIVNGDTVLLNAGMVYLDGHAVSVPEGTLEFADPGIHTIWLDVFRRIITVADDATLVNPLTGEPTAEREKWIATLQTRDTTNDPWPEGAIGRTVVALYAFNRDTGELLPSVPRVVQPDDPAWLAAHIGHGGDEQHPVVTPTDAGFMAPADKTKLDQLSPTAPPTHTHDDRYYTEAEADAQLAAKADVGHQHDTRYAPLAHVGTGDAAHAAASGSHAGFMSATDKAKLDQLSSTAPPTHAHDDRYYTEAEVDAQLATKAPLSHAHDGAYAPLAHVGAAGTAHPAATAGQSGFLSAADKAKLDGMAPGSTRGNRTATLVVAASNSSEAGKAAADYVCSGQHAVSPRSGDQDTINAAIAVVAALPGGGRIVLLEGTYQITGPIRLSNKVHLTGVGLCTHLDIPSGYTDQGAFNMIENADTANGNSDIAVTELSLDGSNGSNTGVDSHGIYWWGVVRGLVEGVYVLGCAGHGIYLAGNSGYPIWFTTVRESTVDACRGIGIFWNGNGWMNALTDCFVLRSEAEAGVKIASMGEMLITDNRIYYNFQHGLVLDSGCARLTVAHNIVSHNGIAANNTYDNIRLSMADRCLVQGNLCRRYMMGADLDQSKYGINIVVGQNNFVTGNHLYQAGVTDDLVDTGTSTYLHANVTSGGLEAP